MGRAVVHHIEIGVVNGLRYVGQLVSQYNFTLVATRSRPAILHQWVLSSGTVRLLVTQMAKEENPLPTEDPYVHSWLFPGNTKGRESVFNIALRVTNLPQWLSRLSQQKAELVKPLQTVSDAWGRVQLCMVKSCAGNLVHTLVDDSCYSGPFLPGFQPAGEEEKEQEKEEGCSSQTRSPPVVDFVDHVALYVPCGSSSDVVSWYEQCLCMKRFFVSREDTDQEGLVVSSDSNLGVRLKVLEFCSQDPHTAETDHAAVKFVMAEKLPDSGPDQMDTFFANHGGPGVGHVALHTKDIIAYVRHLRGRGVQFAAVPYTYYTEVGRQSEMKALKLDMDLMKDNGILLGLDESDQRHNRYLMQIFTTPLSDEDTFYLELIQRVGATGFGAENVRALRRSMQAYLQQKQATEAKEK